MHIKSPGENSGAAMADPAATLPSPMLVYVQFNTLPTS